MLRIYYSPASPFEQRLEYIVVQLQHLNNTYNIFIVVFAILVERRRNENETFVINARGWGMGP